MYSHLVITGAGSGCGFWIFRLTHCPRCSCLLLYAFWFRPGSASCWCFRLLFIPKYPYNGGGTLAIGKGIQRSDETMDRHSLDMAGPGCCWISMALWADPHFLRPEVWHSWALPRWQGVVAGRSPNPAVDGAHHGGVLQHGQQFYSGRLWSTTRHVNRRCVCVGQVWQPN